MSSFELYYPGDEYVDIVAGSLFNDNLDIPAYEEFLKLGKALGMYIYGPSQNPEEAEKGDFGTRRYISRIKQDYPALAFWISYSDWDENNKTTYHSLINNSGKKELMNDLAVHQIKWRYFMKIFKSDCPSGINLEHLKLPWGIVLG